MRLACAFTDTPFVCKPLIESASGVCYHMSFRSVTELFLPILFHETTSSFVPFALEMLFFFDSGWSTTHGWYVTISVANKNVIMSFFAVFKLFRVCICSYFENTLISYRPNHL
jgi:hypothetical protein